MRVNGDERDSTGRSDGRGGTHMKEKVLKTHKGVIHYWYAKNEDKNANTVFFLHGLTADHSMFEEQIACFKEEYNVLAWDAPAHGKSRPFETFSFEDSSEYIRDIINECSIDKAVFVGQSLGGYFSQSFIKRYPERVKGFVSIDSTPYGHTYYSKLDIWILKRIEWMAMCYPLRWMKRAMAKRVSVSKRAYDNMMQMLSIYEKRELCHLMGLGYAGFLQDNCDLEIPCPVQLIYGEKDRTGKVKDYNREWAKRTHYPLQIINDAAHNANVDNPQAVNDCIRSFLATLQ